MTIRIPIDPDKYYHIFNHANGKENLFITEGNYSFFLKKYKHYISPIADTFAYCLLPNHFHFAVRIKSHDEIHKRMLMADSKLEENEYVSKQFSNLFSCYTQSFNKQRGRMGSLFMQAYKRKHVDSDDYFRKLIHYIHYNPVHHELSDSIRKWKFSSFNAFLNNNKTSNLNREGVIAYFDDIENFLVYHSRGIDNDMISDLEL